MTSADHPDGPALDAVWARLDDLDAHIARVSSDLAELTASVAVTLEPGPATPPPGADPGAPPLPVFDTLDAWVTNYFALVFARPVGGEFRWCPHWRDHPEAVTRLEALWRSWETLRLDPNLGIAGWLTSYLDPQLAALTSRAGTFAQCTANRHAVPSCLPFTTSPAEPSR